MKFRFLSSRISCFVLCLAVSLFSALAFAQAPSGTMRGQVTDPSGAAVGNATVLLTTPSGASIDTTTNKDGFYEFTGLVAGKYTVKVVAKGFALFTKEGIVIAAQPPAKVDVRLSIEEQEQKVIVTDSQTKVDVDPANNAGAIVMKDKDLEALSDDPDELLTELQALAGPSAGPNGGQIYIDGFTAGQLPPKASIREIRINQNPFSAEYDKLGYGRIEILTKPGTDQFHGQLFASGNSSAFNSRNPFESLNATQPPGYHSTQFSGNVGGPLNKKSSFFLNLERRDISDLSVSNGQTVDPVTFAIVPFTQSISNPRTRTNFNGRVDYQATASNTMSLRYQFFRNTEENDGLGGFSFPSLGINSHGNEHTVQFTDTQTISPRIINETRFQFRHEDNDQSPQSLLPTVNVSSAVSLGGNSGGTSSSTEKSYELQNITYYTVGKHALKFGGRLRVTDDTSAANGNFNGTYTFSSRPNPDHACVPSDANNHCQITPIEAYQLTLKNGPTAPGAGANYYTVNTNTAGLARVGVTYADAGLYFQDDWRLRPNMTLSAGLRYETQNAISDHTDFSPRIGFAWGIDGNAKKSAKTILRLGYGIFYDRFNNSLLQQLQLANGIIQQQYQIPNPSFFNPTQTFVPPPGSPSNQFQYLQNLNNLRAPYTMQTGVTVERQLSKNANLSVTYLNSRGVHQFYTAFTNVDEHLVDPKLPILYQYQSAGDFKQNQLIINSSIRMGTRLSIFGYYTLNYANSDTSGASGVPSNPNDLGDDYGRASFDVRHRIFMGGTVGGPYGLRFSPFMIFSSGGPFNITTGQDPFGDAAFNARAAFASCSLAGVPGSTVVSNRYGCFDKNPQPGETIIPINYGTGPNRFTFNLRVSKTFGFGIKKEAQAADVGGPMSAGPFGRGQGGGGRGGFGGGRGPDGGSSNSRYSLTFSASGRNIFNNVNLSNPIGNLSSPLFGQSNGLAGGPFGSSSSNRRIDLQVTFSF